MGIDRKDRNPKSVSIMESRRTIDTTSIFEEFSGPNFDPDAEATKKCEERDRQSIELTAKRCDQSRATINEKIVHILETDSRLFIALSQCISNFEREFSEYPPKIVELKKMVAEARNFPVPSFDEVPPIPKARNSEIIDQPHWLINAPLKYEALVQQHRISESIELVVKCLAERGRVRRIDEWAEKIRQVLQKDIQVRLKSLPLNSEEAKREFRELQSLGFEAETVTLFLKLASKNLEEKLSALPSTDDFLLYVRSTSSLLCNEVAETARTFLFLCPGKYLSRLVAWVVKQIETRMPISHPEVFAGNFNAVKDSVKIMMDATQPLTEMGISTLHLFEAAPQKMANLLAAAAKQHISDVSVSILDDEWDIDLSDIGEAKIESYPLSSSYEHFRAHLVQFHQELSYLYDPEIFYDCARLMKEVLTSYSHKCLELLTEEKYGVEVFCAVATQLLCVQNTLIPESIKEFQAITENSFPGEQETMAECDGIVSQVIRLLVDIFMRMWSDILVGNRVDWKTGTSSIDPQFTSAIDVMAQLVTVLKLPGVLFQQASDMIAENVLKVVQETSETVFEPEELNSFDFHWTYFSRRVQDLFPRRTNEKFREGLASISNKLGPERNITQDERMTLAEINKAVQAALKESS